MFPEFIDYTFLPKVIKPLTRADALLDPILTNEEELGCCDHETVVLGQNSRKTALD